MDADTSEATRIEMQRLALQTEIEFSLMSVDSVLEASVILDNISPTTYPIENENQPSARVTVYLARQISNMEVEQLAIIVADLATGINTNNVVIRDQSMTIIYSGFAEGENQFYSINEPEYIALMRTHRENTIRDLLISHYQDVRVSVNMVLTQYRDVEHSRLYIYCHEDYDFCSEEYRYNWQPVRRAIPAGTYISELSSIDVIANLIINHNETTLIESGVIDGETGVTWAQFQNDNRHLVWLNDRAETYTRLIVMLAHRSGIPAENVHVTIIGVPNFISKN